MRKVAGSASASDRESVKYYVYVLRSIPTGRHYIGVTAGLRRRLDEHNSRSGRWTSRFKPWELAAVEEFEDRGAAARREAFLKSRAGIVARKELFARSVGFVEPM